MVPKQTPEDDGGYKARAMAREEVRSERLLSHESKAHLVATLLVSRFDKWGHAPAQMGSSIDQAVELVEAIERRLLLGPKEGAATPAPAPPSVGAGEMVNPSAMIGRPNP
jgi:hypothetical protein